jgi:menaquinone-dependent protoporphyrinogen oxidase
MTVTTGTKVLVAYATKRGSTREVAEAVAATLSGQGLDVDVEPASSVASIASYDAVVLGGALYTGRWHRDARAFLERHRVALATREVAVFGMGPQTLDEQDVAGSRAQLDRALARMPEVVPVAVAIFGGVVDPDRLRFPFNRMPASDARDWDAIEAWAKEVAAAFERVARHV